MALPVTIGSGLAPSSNFNWLPPFKSSAGAWYVIVYDSVADGALDAYKASDPTSSFTVQDAANHPVPFPTGELINTVSAVQDGDLIHVAALQTSGSNHEAKYARFNMGSDAWDIVGVTNRFFQVASSTLAGFDPSVDIAINSDRSRLAIHYQGHRDKIMGTDQGRAYVAGAVDLDATSMNFASPSPTKTAVTPGDQTVQESPRICPGLSGEFHLLYRWDATAGDIRQVRLNTTPALNTDEDTGHNLRGVPEHLGKPIAFLRSGTQKIRCGVSAAGFDTEVLRFDAHSGSGTYSLDEITTDNAAQGFYIALACDGSTVWAIYQNGTSVTDRLYRTNDQDSDSWAADTEHSTTDTLVPLGANVYFRAGQPRFGIVYHDGTDTKYDEIALGNFTSTQLSHNKMADL
jgi:hypothetical protein